MSLCTRTYSQEHVHKDMAILLGTCYSHSSVPKTMRTRYMDGSVQRTTHASNHLFFSFLLFTRTELSLVISHQNLWRYTFIQKRCRDGVTCMCSPLHTAIHISSSRGFWYCHLYILLRFWKMLFMLVCVLFVVPLRGGGTGGAGEQLSLQYFF